MSRFVEAHRLKQEACFVVRDHDGQRLAYVYFEDEPGRRLAAKLLSSDDIGAEASTFTMGRGATDRGEHC